MTRIQSFLSFGVALLSFTLASPLPAAPVRDLAPAPAMADEARLLIQLLETVHYANQPLSEDSAEQLLTNYMGDLDFQRLYFSSADREAILAKHRGTALRDLRQKGDLSPAFDIFNIYRERSTNRIAWVLDQLNGEFDFSTDAVFAMDRTKAEWPSPEEADTLWRQRLKYEILQDLLNDKPIETARENVERRYNRALKNIEEITPSEVQEVFLSSLTRLRDPHSTFFSADTLEEFDIQMKLSLIGIGAQLSEEDGYCVIRELIPGGPAALSGLIGVGDKIVAVAQEGEEPVDVVGMRLRRVVQMIRGKQGTVVGLTIVPADADTAARRQITIVRDVVRLNASRAKGTLIDVPGADGSTVPVGVIEVPTFYGNLDDPTASEKVSVSQDVEALLKQLSAAGAQGIVLDLRRNGGGLLPEAIDMTGLFIPRGPVVQVRDSMGHVVVKPDTDPKVAYDGPLVVLTSRFSASASEIVAGALQNYGRAIVVGDSSTHGKGTVQAVMGMKTFMPRQLFQTQKVGAAKLTVQKFYLPNGASTQMRGVIPDITLPSVEDFLPIGESDLPNALQWDTIQATRFPGQPLARSMVEALREQSAERRGELPEFQMLQERIDWFRVRQEEKTISLNLDRRREQKQADEDFRERIKATQRELASSAYAEKSFLLAGVQDEPSNEPSLDELTGEDEDLARVDVHLREALRIMADAIRLSDKPADWVKEELMLAARHASRS
jgi:carboxyl-terminal processing protease